MGPEEGGGSLDSAVIQEEVRVAWAPCLQLASEWGGLGGLRLHLWGLL